MSDDKKSLKKTLTPMQYYVTQEQGTEPPFENEYYQQNQEGIYVDVVSKEVVFTTNEQYDAGCGWPSFTKPVQPLKEVFDTSFGMRRTEVRTADDQAHLGHVFDDGPKDKGGLRYCINSAALKFIPVEDLEKEGYQAYLSLFKK